MKLLHEARQARNPAAAERIAGVAITVSVLLSPFPAGAGQGDCAQPISTGADAIASDCLFILRAAVGSEACSPECVCDTSGDSSTTATDALVCLKSAVRQPVVLRCRCLASPLGDELQVNTFTAGDQARPAVAADAQGNLLVVWESGGSSGSDSDGSSIQAQRFSSTGDPVGAEVQVNAFTTGNQSLPAVAAQPDGSFVAAWSSAGASASDPDGSVRARRLDASGAPIGTEFEVNTYTTGEQGAPHVAVNSAGGDFAVVWQSYGSSGTDTSQLSIQGQRYDSDANPLGTEFQVNTLTGESQTEPVVSFRGSGGFVVAWASLAGSGTDPDANVRAQLFGEDGERESTEFRINSYTTGAQSSPAVASDGANGFFVVWHSEGTSLDDGDGIMARHFGPQGQTGTEFAVNADTTGAQTGPRIASLDKARFVVVWTSAGSAEDADYTIRGQVFGTDAFRIGTELQVNTYTTGGQLLGGVARQPGGDFTVVWDSEGSTGTDSAAASIQRQRFD